MKDTVGIILVGALCLSALVAIWDSVTHFMYVGELQQLMTRQLAVNNVRAAAQGLANEAIEFSRRNPAIDPLLFQFDLKARPGATNNQPSGRKP